MIGNRILVSSVLLLLSLSAGALAQVSVAETLLVDVRAEDLAYGPAGTWTNHGTLGSFTPKGAPVVEDVGGLKAVTFDGSSWFDGPTSVPGIEGQGTRSIEVWVFNPTTVSEETMVHWSHRGGPAGTNMSFNYGNNTTWGAVGHWDTPDMAWGGSVAPCPTLGKWWHLVYTYDGTTCKLYANGQAAGSEAMTLNTHPGNIIRIAAQGNTAGTAPESGLSFTGSIAVVRIHDGVLTPKQITENYKLGGPRKATSPDPANGAVGVAMALLKWTPASVAMLEDIYLGTTPNLTTADRVKARQSVAMKMYYYPVPLVPGQKYYWRVDEIDSAQKVYTGDVWSFTAVSLTAFGPVPADGAHFQDPNLTLTWQPGKDPSTYDVYFGTSRDEVAAGAGGTLKGTQATMDFYPGLLDPGTTYYWRVDLTDTTGKQNPGGVWSFTTIPQIAVSDPNLVGWWKLDEAEGTLAVDWSGKNNHGAILGGTKWIEGYDGAALKLNGEDGYVSLPIGSVLATLNSATITSWVDFSNSGGTWQRIFDFGNGSASQYVFLCPRTGTTGPLRMAMTTAGGGANESLIDASQMLPSGWHHVAAVINGATRTMQIYVDGASVASGSTQTLLTDMGVTTQNWLGRSQYPSDAYLKASLDDFRIYNFAMAADQIPETMRGDPALAWNPQPARDSNVDIRQATSLSWTAGQSAAQHDVYFGTDQNDVTNADTASALYKGRQAGTDFSLDGLVTFGGGAYYWRIDEVEADGTTVHKGRTWAFTVPNYLVIDEFESYTDEVTGRIFQTWIDGWGYTEPAPGNAGNGTGSTVGYTTAPFAERAVVHGAKQAMPFDYNNIIQPYYSETDRTWSTGQNWTTSGVDTLSLWFRGQPVAFADDGATITMSAAGDDIWNNADAFRFAYKPLNGDGSITVKVNSLVQTDVWAKAGVMIRKSLTPGSCNAANIVSAASGVNFQYRAFDEDVSASVTQTGLAAPYWVRLTRTGNTFKAEVSADSKTWSSVGADATLSSYDVTMTGSIYIGLCVTSHNTDPKIATTAVFSDVKTTGGVSGPWQVADIGMTHPGNDPAQLYVALQDSAGRIAVVNHPDLNAVLTTTWTEWQIPLTQFAGVNAKSITKMYLGVGDRKAPKVGGHGKLYIDDIRVVKP